MPVTNKATQIIPELLADVIEKGFTGVKALLGTRAVVMNPTLPTEKRGGDVVKVPYFLNIGEAEDVAEGAALTPAAVTNESETATVARAGKAIEVTKWAEIAAAYADPHAVLGAQMVEAIARRWDKALIDAASAALPDMTHDVSAAGTTLGYDVVIEGKKKWGDEIEDLALIAMHSKPFYDLLLQKDSTGRPLALESVREDGTAMRSYLGVPVILSDRLTPSSGTYTTILCKPGALALWFNPQNIEVEVDKDILKHTRLASVNSYLVAYRYKYMPGKSKGGVALIKHK